MQTILIKETIRLAQAVNQALVATGCIHRLKNNAGTRTLPVPLERTRYDPDTGLLWVEINPQRLPRGFTFSRLRGEGLQEKIMEAFHRRVVVMQYGQSIIIASLLKLPSKTPGHMKGYTFGTSDFVKADIQPRAVPAT